MKDRFNLEEDIMSCWGVTNDLDLLHEALLDLPEPLTEDEMSNYIMGLRSMYDLKFQRLWDTFLQANKLDIYFDRYTEDDQRVDCVLSEDC